MIVADASAVVSGLLNAGPARELLGSERVHVPHLADVEVASALRRAVAADRITAAEGWSTLDTWRRLGVTRHAAPGLLDRVWQLRANVTAYDATYVALAEALGCALVTADGRLTRAPGLACPVTVVPR
ncbi:Predicted nucleic acid-binding protein, contains PIN domain [Geodermatophilus dictyosporus]|uniref:Ribonuclease VapC n=1 Tax=Geodermatophilus dictyosporus TaxID=1523247 RepID=A0A1I5U3L8_9ACTN|nr:type II toxin-antitoxin system VapC family toxin [Geodermatophilus dictyosporus]SFP89928.1 Predicted nucleic acid-binding protein, contains PIN domain [Geodermatophilus dictyosporus]